MSEEQQSQVAERQMDQAFEEVGGRATPPDRLDQILRRAAAVQQHGAAGTSGTSGMVGIASSNRQLGRLWAAALLLLGLAVTITASLLKNQQDADQIASDAGGDSQLVRSDGATAGVMADGGKANGVVKPASDVSQDPQPQPKPEPTPKPKPTPKPETPKQESPKQGGDPAPSKTDKILPKGTDPADLAVLRSAEAMLDAEKRLQSLIKEGKIAGVDQILPFDQLNNWQYQEGLQGMPEAVKALAGKKVLMLGFMLPIDEVRNIKEFLLVASLWSCCYGQPPDIHGIVRCVMPKDKVIDYQFEPLKIVGTFRIKATVLDGYCVDIYQLEVDYVEVLQAAKPLEEPGPLEKPGPQEEPGPLEKPGPLDKTGPRKSQPK